MVKLLNSLRLFAWHWWNYLGLQERIFKKTIEDMAGGGLRCIAIAYRTYIMENVPSSESELAQWAIPEDDLVLLAIVGIRVYASMESFNENLYIVWGLSSVFTSFCKIATVFYSACHCCKWLSCCFIEKFSYILASCNTQIM